MNVREVLERARQRVEDFEETPDTAIWESCRKRGEPLFDRTPLFHRAKDLLEQAGDFRGAIVLAKETI